MPHVSNGFKDYGALEVKLKRTNYSKTFYYQVKQVCSIF